MIDSLSSTLNTQPLPSTFNHPSSKVFVPSPLTLSEKLEFLYLTPYYLQAAFFITGTISWFIAEVIFQVRLPFWTEIWGWSLILTNMLALPLMNMVGLFLEEAEEKDYLGLFSFVALSYVVAPFQAYAAIKGFLEKEEGPWFRTPKTGRITDVFTPGRFYRFVWGVFGRGKPAPALAKSDLALARSFLAGATSPNPYLSFATANNRFQNFRIRPKQIRWFGRATLSILIIMALLFNYLSLFVPQTNAQAAPDPTIEQQINIMDRSATITSASYGPTDNSLGLFTWDSTKYSATITVYFEAVFSTANATHTAYVSLFTSGGSQVTQSEVTTTGDTNYHRVRSGNISGNLTDGTQYSVRGKNSTTPATSTIKAARLIVVQQNATNITTTRTIIEVGNNETLSVTTTATALTDKKLWLYTSGSYDGTVTTTFSATVKKAGGGSYTAYACLYSTSGSEIGCVSDTSGSFVYPTPASVSLTNGTTYEVRLKSSAAQAKSVAVANAHVIIDQTAAGGLTKMELYHQYVNTLATDTNDVYTSQNYLNYYDPGNFEGGTFTYYFESTIKTSAGTGYAVLNNGTSFSDNLDDSSIDASWTTNTPTGSIVETSVLTITTADSGGSDWWSGALEYAPIIYRTAGTGDFIATVKLNSYTVNNFTHAGIMIYRDRDNAYLWGRHRNDDTSSNNFDLAGIIADTGNGITSLSSSTLPMWLRVRKEGTTLYFDYSTDGTNFTNLHSRTQDFTPVSVGMFSKNWSTAPATSPTFSSYSSLVDRSPSPVSTTSTSYGRQRTASGLTMPTFAVELDTQIKNSAASGNTTSVSGSTLIIQISNLQIPENIVWILPVAIFFPAIIRWYRKRRVKMEPAVVELR
ncbi:MAG: Fibronectin, type III domain protein [Candidatus Levybacteria bacterium GW2011_GWA1_39_11]|nr:MAG: Fibronectin, type III domain protein [Candidatus Levybacteria bacterium GW2011_GWA1_39_11]